MTEERRFVIITVSLISIGFLGILAGEKVSGLSLFILGMLMLFGNWIFVWRNSKRGKDKEPRKRRGKPRK